MCRCKWNYLRTFVWVSFGWWDIYVGQETGLNSLWSMKITPSNIRNGWFVYFIHTFKFCNEGKGFQSHHFCFSVLFLKVIIFTLSLSLHIFENSLKISNCLWKSRKFSFFSLFWPYFIKIPLNSDLRFGTEIGWWEFRLKV